MPKGIYKRTKKIKLICPQCGKEFEKYKYDIETRDAKYCSLECSHKGKIKKQPKRILLYNKYWKDKKSVNQLAKEYGVSKGLMYNWFRDMDILTRSISEAVIISGNNMSDKQKKEQIKKLLNSQKSGMSRKGRRNDIGIYCRSRWEANVCRYYNFVGIKWIYEPKIFYFNDSSLIKKKIKRGTLSYTPDFYLPEQDKFIEVKGWFRPSDKTKLRRFKKYYPGEFAKLKFIVLNKYSKSKNNGKMIKFICDDLKINFNEIENYNEIKKWSKLLPGWEE